MTLQEALKYDNLLKHNLMEKAASLNLSEETASQIMDQHVLVTICCGQHSRYFLELSAAFNLCSLFYSEIYETGS